MMPNKTIDRTLIDRIRLRVREAPASPQRPSAPSGRELAVTRTGARGLHRNNASQNQEPVGAK